MRFLLIFIIACCPFLGVSQTDLSKEEQKLSELFVKLKEADSDSLKLSLCNQLGTQMKISLQEANSFSYPFGQVSNLGKVASPDGKLRVYTWNCVLSDGTYKYFGFLQVQNGNQIQLIELKDRHNGANLFATLSADSWLGCLYYQVIPFKAKGGDNYLLLGWDGNNMSSTKKLIEVLSIDKRGQVSFGKPVISWRGKMLSRVIFEYAKQARMSIQYQEKEKRLVFDHLAPSSPNYRNQFEYYGPDFTFDALQYKKGNWELVEDIDIRNKKKK